MVFKSKTKLTFFTSIILVFIVLFQFCAGPSSSDDDDVRLARVKVVYYPKAPNVGDVVTFDASLSTGYNPNRTVAEYKWSISIKPANSNTTLSSTVRPIVTITPDVTGEYQVRCWIKDAEDYTNVSFTDIDASLNPPIAVAGPDMIVDVGENFILDGSASYHPLGLPFTAQWQTYIDIYEGPSCPARASVVYFLDNNLRRNNKIEEPGTYEFELQVIEVNNRIEDSYDIVQVRSNPPEIKSFQPPGGLAGTEVTIRGKNFSNWKEGKFISWKGEEYSGPGNTVKFNGLEAENITVTDSLLVVVVPSGATTGEIRITITETQEEAWSQQDFAISGPVANAGRDTVLNFPTSYYLDGSASFNPHGTQLYYLWQVVRKPAFGTPDLYPSIDVKPFFRALEAGSYEIELTVATNNIYTENIDKDTVIISSGEPKIDLFDPASGPAGTEVTIWGTNISLQDEGNFVSFPGLTAEGAGENNASSGVIYIVPDSAKTGPVFLRVIETGDTTLSSADFIVTE